MKARELMTPDPHVVTGGESVALAARLMRDFGVGAVPVVDDHTRMHLRGVITDRDIAVRCAAAHHDGYCRVEDHMTPAPLQTVSPDADAREVMEQMERECARLVLVAAGDRLVGIISRDDLAPGEDAPEPRTVEEVLARVSAPPPEMG